MLTTHTDSVSTLKSSQHLCLGLSHPSKPALKSRLVPRAESYVVCRAAFPEQVCLRCDILRPAQVCASSLTLAMIVLDTVTRSTAQCIACDAQYPQAGVFAGAERAFSVCYDPGEER